MSNNENDRKMHLGEIIFACVVLVTGIASFLAFLYFTAAETRDYILPSGLVILLVALIICRAIVKTDKQIRTLRILAFVGGTMLYLITVSVTSATLAYTAQWMIFLALCWLGCGFLTGTDDRDEHAENRYPYPRQQLTPEDSPKPKPEHQSPAPQPQKPVPVVPDRMTTEAGEAALLENEWKLKEYIKHYELSLKTVFKMLRHPRALPLLDIYCTVHELPMAAEFLLFQLPDPRPLVKEYIKHRQFQSTYAEAMMFDLSDPADLVRDYYNYQRRLRDVAQRRILEMSNPDEVLAAFTEEDYFDEEVVDDMFALPDPLKFIKAHIEADGDLTDGQIIKLINLTDEQDFVDRIIENYNIDDEVVDAMFTAPNALRWIREYLKDGGDFTAKQIIKLMNLAGAEDIVDYIFENYDIEEEVADAMFTAPNALHWVRKHIKNGGDLTDEQIVKVIKLAGAEDLVESVIKDYDIGEEAVDAMLESPNASRWIRMHLKNDGTLNDEQQMRLCKLHDQETIRLFVDRGGSLCEEVENLLCTDLTMTETFRYLVQETLICNSTQMLIYQRPDAQELILLRHQSDYLSDEARALAQAKGWLPLPEE